ncbi:MAG TPA: helix-turn-helix domain-containing protein [Actinophytocola sp.]|uniref:TetR/AcrR family transcriptional regulator n=1 Tax=Actinophytocola sp. TaxID=1872138 RepID=UPI002DBD822E|nr:helix-turn-helix domain-containing protein [Actinophytocola sp.]HEU5476125.1 helix-turn-helix domain-containing protein [Actinophytocola sp.]
MARTFRNQVEEEILDRVAGEFAQHGFEHTSLKALADAVGLSKAGLLHHYPSKDALFQAARELGAVQSRRVLDQVAGLPLGVARDRRVLELLTDVALDRPGLVALLFRAVTAPEDPASHSDALLLPELFGVDLEARSERAIRVVGALSAMAVLTLAANRAGEKTTWRPHIIATCLDTLGHPRPLHDDQVEG